MVEGFVYIHRGFIWCELPKDYGDMACGERLFYIHYAQLCVSTLPTTVYFSYYTQPYVFRWTNWILWLRYFLHLYALKVCDFSYVSLAEIFS